MSKKRNSNSWLVLILIVALAAFLRFWRLEEVPSFHTDEASLGYSAYSLLKTGRDENGQFLPIHVDMYGIGLPAGYRYLDILPIKIFGLNEFATRFPSALFGTLTVLLIYLFVKELFAYELVAISASFLMAVSPWHITLSRAASETNTALFFVVLGAYLFLNGIIRAKKSYFFYASIVWGIGVFIYHSPRLFVPALAMGLIIILKPLIKKNLSLSIGFSLLLTIFIAIFLIFKGNSGVGRFQQVSIFNFPEIRLVLTEQISEDGRLSVPIWMTRTFHNKIVNYSYGYLKEYFRYFSLDFLFISGGLPKWYVIPNMGLMYLWELPFFLIGIYFLFTHLKNRLFMVPLIWLLLSPTIAAATRDDVPNILRAELMIPAMVMITGFGIGQIWIWARTNLVVNLRWLILGLISLIFIWNFAYFIFQYFVHASIHRAWYRNEKTKEMVLEVRKRLPMYDKVVISKAETNYMHFLFFLPIEPAQYQQWGSPRDPDNGGFGKLVFKPGYCPVEEGDLELLTENTLWVANGSCPKDPFKEEKALAIYRPDGTVAYWIYPK